MNLLRSCTKGWTKTEAKPRHDFMSLGALWRESLLTGPEKTPCLQYFRLSVSTQRIALAFARFFLFSRSSRPIVQTPDRANSATKSSQGIIRIPAAAGESLVSFEAPTPQEFTSWPAQDQASLENIKEEPSGSDRTNDSFMGPSKLQQYGKQRVFANWWVLKFRKTPIERAMEIYSQDFGAMLTWLSRTCAPLCGRVGQQKWLWKWMISLQCWEFVGIPVDGLCSSPRYAYIFYHQPHIWKFPKIGKYPQNIHFDGMFHDFSLPSNSSGTPMTMETPSLTGTVRIS